MRRIITMAAAALLAAAGLTGCGDDGATTAAPTTTAAAAETTTAETAATTEAAGPFAVSTPAFADGGAIPVAYTCDGANDQMALAFTAVPAGTTSLALTVVDPDGGDWIHWVIWNIPPESGGLAAGLPAGDLPDGSRQGANDYAQALAAGDLFPGGGEVRIDGWDGPCPGAATHRYIFTLYALTGTIDLPTGSPGADILGAIEAARADGSLIGEATMTGLYPPG